MPQLNIPGVQMRSICEFNGRDYSAYLKVISMCFDLNSRGFAYAKLNLSLNINKK